jgi:hypothetical protein
MTSSTQLYYLVDLKREKEFPETGIYVRAKRDNEWVSADIAHLDRASLNAWLRSRDTVDWPVNVVMLLLKHPPVPVKSMTIQE